MDMSESYRWILTNRLTQKLTEIHILNHLHGTLRKRVPMERKEAEFYFPSHGYSLPFEESHKGDEGCEVL